MERSFLTRDDAALADPVSEHNMEKRFNSVVNQFRDLVKAQLTQPYEKEIPDLKEEKRVLTMELNAAKDINSICAWPPTTQEFRLLRGEIKRLKDESTALRKSTLVLEQEANALKEQFSALKSEIAALKDDAVARIGTSDWFKDRLRVIDEAMMGMEKDFTLHTGVREAKIRKLEHELKQEEERNAKRAKTLESVKEMLIGTEN